MNAVRISTHLLPAAYSGVEICHVFGGAGNDIVYGNGGEATLTAGSGTQVLDGGDGNDVLIGGTGSDTLIAGGGDNTLVGGSGHTVMIGGDGNNSYTLTAGGMADITDAPNSHVQTLWLPQGAKLADYTAMRSDEDLILSGADGTAALIRGFFKAAMSATQWIVTGDGDAPQYLAAWVAQHPPAVDANGQYDAMRRAFQVSLKADLTARGLAGQALGSLPDERYYREYFEQGKGTVGLDYTFGGVTSATITADGGSLSAPSSESDSIKYYSVDQTYQVETPTYKTVWDKTPHTFTITVRPGELAMPQGANVTLVGTSDGLNDPADNAHSDWLSGKDSPYGDAAIVFADGSTLSQLELTLLARHLINELAANDRAFHKRVA